MPEDANIPRPADRSDPDRSDRGRSTVDPSAVDPESAARDGQDAGPELARAVLEAARIKRAARTGQVKPSRSRRPRGYSGPGPDPRDPQPFGSVLARLVQVRGWQKPAAEARLFGMWSTVVGAELAGHSKPVKLEDGELTIEADSTAWATQIKLLAGKLLGRIAAELGTGVVTRLNVHGPVTPSWTKGPRRVRGRGPRDTYG